MLALSVGVGLAFTAFLAGASAAAESEAAAEPEIVEGPYLVVDAASGRVLIEHDAARPWFPASTTKLMTIYTAFQAVAAGELTLQSTIVYSNNAAAQPASKMGFRPGTTLTLEDALKMMMVKSANDIAVAVAETVAGSVRAFADRMNEAARQLGMTGSHFVNPHGLPDERQVTTARDMALVARALLKDFPQYRDYYKLHAIQIGSRVLRNYNTLLTRYPGATGMKTGFICASGYNLVGSAEREGREIIAVVFGEYGGRIRAEHAAQLLDIGLSSPADRSDPTITLANVSSGGEFTEPLDMRPHVCGPHRVATASESNEDGGADEPASSLTPPSYLGPPIKVFANIPAEYGEPGFVARLPRPRPGESDGPRATVLDAFVPIEDDESRSPSEEAIDAAAGAPAALPAGESE
jgi:D-alanyl-D-alanine carboxypeptidase